MIFDVPTKDEVREIIREEIAAAFASIPFGSVQPNTSDEADEIGNIELAMELTGKKKSTIYSLCGRREIPHFKKSGQLYFSKRALLEWLQSGKRQTVTELLSSANSQKGKNNNYEKRQL